MICLKLKCVASRWHEAWHPEGLSNDAASWLHRAVRRVAEVSFSGIHLEGQCLRDGLCESNIKRNGSSMWAPVSEPYVLNLPVSLSRAVNNAQNHPFTWKPR